MNQVFWGNAIGSINGPNYGTVGGNLVTIDGQRVTVSNGSNAVTASHIKVVATDAQGRELQSFSLPTGTSINIDVHVEKGTEIKNFKSHNAEVSLHGPGAIDSFKCTNGSVEIHNAEKVGRVNVINGNATIKASKIGDVNAVNGSVIKPQ